MAESDTLTLFGETNWVSPYVFSAYVALLEKGIDFELELLSLDAKEHGRPEYRDRSLTGRVPALRHGDFWLSESSAIDEYLEDVFPPPRWPRLYPSDVRQRARARQLQAWLRSDLLPLREQRPTSSVFQGEAVKPMDAAGQEAAGRLLRACELLLRDGATSLFQEGFSIADADLSLMLHRLLLSRDPVPPKIRGYAEAVWRRPSIQEFVGHARPKAER